MTGLGPPATLRGMVTIVDYGSGNLRSVQKAFEKLGTPARITDDPQVVAESERVVLRWAGPGRGADADVVANLSALVLRAHGRRLEAHSNGMRPWRWLFDSSLHVTRDPVVAWKTVCIGLISHPDFSTY